ncbi:cellulase family glycosylhydrolase [Phycicoccus flavus]|uniref:cellulase family glycosylhydrolase n=1 Tax=Phycicoccus flavus TaxID=2502783 RepID=UPI000FEBD8CB|nr:cellulase family glycosylhydrolase [Phycicoccus flavus]NHA66593.1 glycoside hydrolase family 5 protein [Phycicoccus flavus]
MSRRLIAVAGAMAVALLGGVAVHHTGQAVTEAARDAGPTPRASATPLAHVPPVVGVQYTALWDGVEEADRRQMVDAVSGAGAGWVRLDVAWATLQPSGPDRYDTDWGARRVDEAITTARAGGLKVLLTFYWAPGWATGGDGKAAHPDPAAYARALRWVADRWGDDVDAYEVWNEPNGKRFWNPPDARAYAALLRAAYPAVKAADPTAEVVMGGLEYVDLEWLQELYAAGAKGSYDVLAVHPYPSPGDLPPGAPPDGSKYRFRNLDELMVLMREHGEATVPVWLTEVGWSAHENDADAEVWALGVSPVDQGAYLYDSVRLVTERYPQVKGWFWYTVRDTALGDVHQDSFGLLRADGSRKPAWYALRCVTVGDCADAP